MIPYFILLGLPMLVQSVSKKYRITSGKKTLCETQTAGIDVFMFMFLLLLACRGLQCGNDTGAYSRTYIKYGTQDFFRLITSANHEIGYKLLNKLVWVMGGDYQSFLLVTSIICVFPLWSFYKRESENQLLTILLFLSVSPYVMYFSGIRQAIAMSLGVVAWYSAKYKKLIRFVAVVLLAIQFHNSAFILFLIYPLYYAKITKKWLWFVVPCIIAVYVFKTQIFNVMITLLWEEYSKTDATGATSILLLLIIFGVYSYVLPDDSKMDTDTIALRNILLLSITLQIFALLHPLSMRMNYYFLIFVPILIPKIANRSKKQFSQVAKLSVVVMTVYFMCYFINSVITDKDSLNIFPYIPFWQNY